MNDFDVVYRQLNSEQKSAVDAIEGPVMVLAGPGTGKTQLLSVRTAHILRMTDLYPSNILILTYTNAGVKAMRERLAKIIGPDGYDVVVETFHGFSNTLITESDEAASVKGERVDMTDLERINSLEYLLDHLKDLRPIRNPNAPYLYRRDIEANISALKRDGISPEDVSSFLKGYTPDGKLIEEKHLKRLRAFSQLYSAYEEAKSPEGSIPVFDQRGRYDYDDMILLALQALQSEPELLAQYQEQFQYVMVDEFQDTNGAQLKLLRTLFDQSDSNICVVGDDDQSIYRFQGASVGNFQIFSRLYEKPSQIILHKNYRSQPEILQKTAEIIRQIPQDERVMEKQLEPTRKSDASNIEAHRFGTLEEELTYLVQELKKLEKAEWNDTAVLVRTRRQAQDVIEAFLQAGIPYSTDGKEDIRGEFRIQQLLKILRIATGNLEFEEKDLLVFELLLCDFFEIDYQDLMGFVTYVSKMKSEYRKKRKLKINKKPQEYRLEESHHQMSFGESEISQDASNNKPSLFSELLLRFPVPARIAVKDHEGPSDEETSQLSICKELSLKEPNRLHQAAWVINRLTSRAGHYPVYPLIMEFLQDAGLVDYILKVYDDNEVVRLRELRSVSSFVENLKKASQAKPGIMVDQYVDDLNQLEKHQIPLAGEMVSSAQEGVKILTAHGSKGLEFQTVFIPFCIQDKAWPKRALTNKIPLPHELMIGQELITEKDQMKKLHEYDEIRLFYVAATRAKDRLVFSAAPQNKQVISQFLSNIDLAPRERTEISEEQTLIQLLRRSPQPDPVGMSKEILSGITEEISLSPSSVNTYLRCQRRFLYHHLLKAPQAKTQALVYGQCVHKALEKSYRRFVSEGSFPPLEYFVDQFMQELDWQGVQQSIRQGCLQKIEDAKKWYQKTIEQGPIKPLELERKLTRKLQDGIIFTGQFDKVEMVGNKGEVRVVDYKTGEPDKHIKAIENCDDIFSEDCDDYLRQLIAYKLLYERGHRSLKVTSGSLVFVDPVRTSVKKYELEEGTFTNKTITLTDAMVKDYEKLLDQTWGSIKSLTFDRLPQYDDKKCNICPYSSVCWK